MKITISLFAAALLLTVTSTMYAQLTTSPLEAGLYDFMKKDANVTLIDSSHMQIATADIAWVSPEQITISATIATVTDRQKAEKMIASFNESSSVGTLTIESGSIVMTHFINPKLAKQPNIAQVVAAFNSETALQAVRFGARVAKG